MGIISYREVLPRTFSHQFGSTPSASMKFNCTLDGPTSHQQILDTINIKFGTPPPEWGYIYSLSGSVDEVDYYHAEATYEFGIPNDGQTPGGSGGGGGLEQSPMARPDVWQWSTSSQSGPIAEYFPNDGDNVRTRTIANSAGDPIFNGLTTNFGEMRATITGNRPFFDVGVATSVTGCINSDNYLGGPPYSWMCNGIGGQKKTEVVNGVTIVFWEVSVELSYKRTRHLLYVPDVGLNVFRTVPPATQPEKVSARVKDDSITPPQWIASAEPVALNPDGSQRVPVREDGKWLQPNILTFRVHPAVPFQGYFGVPT
jgi:hypothetical protein